MMTPITRKLTFAAALLAFAVTGTSAQAATDGGKPDSGKKECAQEARRLCPAEMRSFSRKRVEACMIAKIDQTSPVCHAAMLRIKAERDAADKK